VDELCKMNLRGGSGGTTGQKVYTVAGVATVTSDNPTYSNSNYYYMQYMFDGVYQNLNQHANYWLGQSTSQDTKFTFTFPAPVPLSMIRVMPKCRSDSPAPDFQVSVTAAGVVTEVSPRVAPDNIPAGKVYEYAIEQVCAPWRTAFALSQLDRLGTWHLGTYRCVRRNISPG
jgi:hypothetical protein